MLWEVYLATAAICIGFGVALLLARKIKAPKESTVDIDAIAQAVAKALAGQLSHPVDSKQITPLVQEVLDNQIQIDESIIPTKINIDTIESNLDNMGKEKVQKDSSLQESKAKLALLKKKG